MDKKKTQDIVKEAYGKVAAKEDNSCCGCGCSESADKFALSLGYSEEELQNLPADANLGLSCGNPILAAHLKKGEIVLDLGSGAGFDCFIAADKVGESGKVFGLDMTEEMITKAKENASKHKITNVEFILGEIENIPLPDNSVDVVISNCVINLSYDKKKVFQEVNRLLKPGGRAVISDIALKKELPKKLKEDAQIFAGCIAGAVLIDEYQSIAESSGLKGIKLTVKGGAACIEPSLDVCLDDTQIITENLNLNDYAVSVLLVGYK